MTLSLWWSIYIYKLIVNRYLGFAPPLGSAMDSLEAAINIMDTKGNGEEAGSSSDAEEI